MIIQESKLIDETYVDGYYLTLEDLEKLLEDYYLDSEFTNKFYIESWLKKHQRIVKKD